MRSPRRSGRRDTTLFWRTAWALAFLYSLIIVTPLYALISSAFKSNSEILTSPLTPPVRIGFENFVNAEQAGDLLAALVRSVMVVAGASALALALAIPAAYAIAKIQSPLAKWTEGTFALGFLIPAFALLVPVFLMAARIGLLNNPLFLILFYPATVLPLAILVLASFMRKVPRELEESATIDGATRLQIMTRIVIPLVKPGIMTVLILNFITLWNEFLFALVLTNNSSRTIQVAVGILRANSRRADFGMIAAAVLISFIPVYLVFVLFQDRIVSGTFTGATKG